MAKLMIESSKDFDIDLNAGDDDYGLTAFHYACRIGRTELVSMMLELATEYSIDLNARGLDGATAFHEACECEAMGIVKMILKNWKKFGIIINAENNDGNTALDLAIKRMSEYGLIGRANLTDNDSEDDLDDCENAHECYDYCFSYDPSAEITAIKNLLEYAKIEPTS